MKTPKPIFLAVLLTLQVSLSAQVQWYQNQDGSNQPPNGTYASCVHTLGSFAFVACYQWRIINDQYTWKVSKTNTAGIELKSFFITGTTAMVEMRVAGNNTVYVLKKDFPLGQNPEYTIYKLNGNLQVVTQRTITFSGNYVAYNLNAFEIDDAANLFLAGDGQYPDGPGYSPASFIIKTDKNFVTKWMVMDSSATSFVQLLPDKFGRVWVVEDYYDFYPDVRIRKFSSGGALLLNKTVHAEPARNNVYSKTDESGNLYLYGSKSVGDTAQAIWLCKLSRNTGHVLYSKTHFTAAGSLLYDFKIDDNGRIFTVVSRFHNSGEVNYEISRLNSLTGNIVWNRSWNFNADSLGLYKVVTDAPDFIYAIGEKRSGSYFSRGYAIRLRKNGQQEGNLNGPDSINHNISHSLVDGLIAGNGQLIAVGNASGLDTTTYYNTFFRSFASRFSQAQGCNNNMAGKGGAVTEEEQVDDERLVISNNLVVYPNPVQTTLTVSNIQQGEYDRVTVFNMQGAVVLQQAANGNLANMNVSSLTDGVYMLVLRSSATLKEKSMKFIVRK